MNNKLRQKVLERDSYYGCPCCINCGRPHANQLHHVKRRSQGGEDSERNLVTLCFECHTKLHAGDLQIQTRCIEYLRSLYE